MRGRRPTPSALKVLRGNPGKRPIGVGEPDPPAAEVGCPDDLDNEDSRELWNELAPKLSEMGVLTIADTFQLRLLCEQYGQMREFERTIAKDGAQVEVTTAHQTIVNRPHPLLNTLMQLRKAVDQKLSLFGLNPTARTRVKVSEPQRGGALDGMRKRVQRKKAPGK